MTECPPLTELPENSIIVTVDQIKFLVVDTYSRSVGTTVNVRCQLGLDLVGEPTVTCMQSGYWSSDPYCSYPSEVTTSSPTSGMDKSMILIIVLAIVGFLVAALIVFVCVAMYWGRAHRKKTKQFRDSSDFYMEDVTSQPYSISRKNMKIYDTSITQAPMPYGQEHLRYNREPYQEPYQQHHVSNEMHYTAGNAHNDRRHYHSPERRHFQYKRPDYAPRYDEMRHAYPENDLFEDTQREYRTQNETGDKPIRDRRRDGYLWQSRSSYSNLNIPRPYYEASALPHYATHYGHNSSAEI